MTEESSNFIYDIVDNDLAHGFSRQIRTRFPPEPNAYLHIGSAKAIYISYSVAKKYGGTFNLRFDDTNPVKEKEEFVLAIEEDIRWLLGENPDHIFYGSDYFDKCYEYAVKLIKDGKAFVCDLSVDELREYRGTLTSPGKNSPYRDRPISESLELFERMKNGEFPEGSRTLRARIDMASPNMNLRDPVIYRILYTAHHRQGNKWCIYPMYDYAHPIQDAIEGITHSLCSIEFDNNRPLYDWVVDNIGFENPPHQYEFSRLNITNTITSKRYLRPLVENGLVDGWDDPRMPTLCALRRRGYSPAAILEFIRRAGVSKTQSLVDIKLLESCIRDELNSSAPRRMAVLEPVKVTLTNYPAGKTETFEVSNNPADPEAGARQVLFSGSLYIEKEDFAKVPYPKFQRLVLGGEVRLMGAYIIRCNEVIEDENGNIKELLCTCDLETGNKMPADGRKVKGTIHWVSADCCNQAEVRLYDNLFTKENLNDLAEGDDYKNYLNPDSLKILTGCKLEKALGNAQAGERFQFVRMGYFCKDSKAPDTFNRVVTLRDSFKPQ